MDRATAIKSYLHAGKSVCPFAKVSPLELVPASVAPRTDRVSIFLAVQAFAAARGNALVILAKTDEAFAGTATWAAETFLELMICCVLVSHSTVAVDEIERYVDRDVRPTLGSNEIRPYLSLHDKALMTICMAPVYPTNHPRYAPHTILVSTWSDDVDEAMHSPAAQKIKAAMAEAHGYIYDANELMLPMPKRRCEACNKPVDDEDTDCGVCVNCHLPSCVHDDRYDVRGDGNVCPRSCNAVGPLGEICDDTITHACPHRWESPT